jgi:hypothetical protein
LGSKSPLDNLGDYWRPDVFHDLFSCRVFKPLPPRSEVFALLELYFQTVNRIYPVYHQGTFMELIEWQYTQQTCNDPARWASINILLAMAYMTGQADDRGPEKGRQTAWLYFKNAVSVMPDITLRRVSLMSIQALLAMVRISLVSWWTFH